MERREGYLTKRGEVVNNWKRRYFVLEKDILRYYKTHADTLLGNPIGEVNVRGARVLVLDADDYGRDHIFGITPSLSSRTYIIAAESDDDRQQWVDGLCQMGVMYVTGAGGTGAIERRFSVDFSNAPLNSTSDSKVDPRSIREGFLVKQGAFMKNWKRRYFVLFEHTMQYYRHKGDVIPAGDIPLLAGAVLEEEPLPPNPPAEIEGKFMFSVVSSLPAFSSRKYLFVADTEVERRDWIASIRNASSEVLKEYANMMQSQGSRVSLLDSGSDEETGSQGPSGPSYRQPSGRISMSPAATRRQTGVRPDLEVVQVKDGMLKKLGGFIKNWKRRYFVLESTQGRRVLKYFNSQVDGKALGEIPILKESTIKREAMNAYFQQHSFSLQSDANSRKYVFVAESEDQMQHWITAIHCATLGHDTCVEYATRNTDQKDMPEPVPEAPEDEAAATRPAAGTMQQQSSTRSLRSSMAGEKKGDVDLGALALNRMRSDVFQVDPESAREGWLAKVNEKQTAVQARYCILTGDTIAYYRTKPSRGNLTSNKKIPLRGSLIKDEQPSSLPTALKLDARYRFIFSVLPLNSQRKYIFATDTEEDYALWVGAIQEQVKVHEQLSSSAADSIKEGFLNFLNLKDYTWTRKYFVLAEKSPLLLRLSSQDSDRSRGEAQLDLRNSATQLVPNDKYSRANTFSVADGDDQKWVLSGDSREDVEDWVDALMYSAEMHQHYAEQNRRGSADSAGWDSDYGSVPANYSFAMGRSAASIAAQAAARTTADRAGAQPYNAGAREVDSDFDD